MRSEWKPSVEERVVSAAESVLSAGDSISFLDVLVRIRWLEPAQINDWRQGRLDALIDNMQVSRAKLNAAIDAFVRWTTEQHLASIEARFQRPTRSGVVDLKFTAQGDADVERFFRAQFVPRDVAEKKRKGLEQKQSRAPEIVVFEIVRDSKCSECSAELFKGDFLVMEEERPFCLKCANLADLEYLGRGDAKLTRRATRYTKRIAVVVRFSRSRGRYERQGILVEADALARAEKECADEG